MKRFFEKFISVMRWVIGTLFLAWFTMFFYFAVFKTENISYNDYPPFFAILIIGLILMPPTCAPLIEHRYWVLGIIIILALFWGLKKMIIGDAIRYKTGTETSFFAAFNT